MQVVHRIKGHAVFTTCGRAVNRYISTTQEESEVTCKICLAGGMEAFRKGLNAKPTEDTPVITENKAPARKREHIDVKALFEQLKPLVEQGKGIMDACKELGIGYHLFHSHMPSHLVNQLRELKTWSRKPEKKESEFALKIDIVASGNEYGGPVTRPYPPLLEEKSVVSIKEETPEVITEESMEVPSKREPEINISNLNGTLVDASVARELSRKVRNSYRVLMPDVVKQLNKAIIGGKKTVHVVFHERIDLRELEAMKRTLEDKRYYVLIGTVPSSLAIYWTKVKFAGESQMAVHPRLAQHAIPIAEE